MHAKADGSSFHIAVADDESRRCGMDFHLLGVHDLGFNVVAAGVELGADWNARSSVWGWYAHNRAAVLHRRLERREPVQARGRTELPA